VGTGVTHPVWPLFDLRLRTERLELRLPTDDEIAALSAVARAGIHAPDEMPFSFPWTDKPSPRFEREFAQFHWGIRANWRPDSWDLELMVTIDGRPIGIQGILASHFAQMRLVHTGSWLGREFQGQGYGKEMRGAVLALAFEGLGAEVAETEAFFDNAASAAVSRAVGYRENGIGRAAPRGTPVDTRRFRMMIADWRGRARQKVEIVGLEACLELFGVGGDAGQAVAGR
jgi:RimJ/RimL family protein N-acetyltransferase